MFYIRSRFIRFYQIISYTWPLLWKCRILPRKSVGCDGWSFCWVCRESGTENRRKMSIGNNNKIKERKKSRPPIAWSGAYSENILFESNILYNNTRDAAKYERSRKWIIQHLPWWNIEYYIISNELKIINGYTYYLPKYVRVYRVTTLTVTVSLSGVNA